METSDINNVKQLFYFFVLHGLWDPSSLTRDQTQALGSESTESYPLDHRGIP